MMHHDGLMLGAQARTALAALAVVSLPLVGLNACTDDGGEDDEVGESTGDTADTTTDDTTDTTDTTDATETETETDTESETTGEPEDPSPEFENPPEIASEGGVLMGTMEVLYADNTVVINPTDGGEVTTLDIYTRTYNGSVPGPTLRLSPSDMIDLDFINSLPENADADTPVENHNWPHRLNSTNFHLHGFHVEPTGNADNVLRVINPGVTVPIAMDVPANHNPGSHWYHGHKHGSLLIQFYGGMSGMIVVEGDLDEVPEVAAAEEKIMIIQELGLNDAGEVPEPNLDAQTAADLFDITQQLFPVSGKVNPIIRMAPGEVQRWRLLNSTTASIMNVELDAHDLNVIAEDGITYDAMDTVGALQMAPGDRADVLIQAGAPGTYLLSSPMGMPMPGMEPESQVLATLIVEGEAVDMGLPSDLPEPDYILPDTSAETPDEVYSISFENGMEPGVFTISGDAYDPSCYNYILQRGDVVDWEITNNAGMGAHPFHIHTNAFQVLEINGMPENPARWQDVVPVPGNGGSVRVRMRVDDFVGGILLHCHITTHEELGMMHKLVIVDDTIPEADKVPADEVDLSDPADFNPDIPGYYVSENFNLCN